MNGLPAVTASFTRRALIIGALFAFSGSTYSVVVGNGVVVVKVIDGVVVVVATDCVKTVVALPLTALSPVPPCSGVVVSSAPVAAVVTYMCRECEYDSKIM